MPGEGGDPVGHQQQQARRALVGALPHQHADEQVGVQRAQRAQQRAAGAQAARLQLAARAQQLVARGLCGEVGATGKTGAQQA